jgi:phosphoglycerate dehydrogenase-like enzyme
LPRHHPFRTLDNVLATPHVGYVSRQNYQVFFWQMIEDIQAWAAGEPVRILT